jgi:large subunit ribosomal protein L25
MLSLAVERRQGAKNEVLRKAGKIPAVFYGPKEASTPVAIDAKEFGKVWKKAGESSVIILKDGTTEHEALIHEVDKHPLTGEPRHADFYVIEKGKKVTVRVPLVYIGVSPAVKDKGAILIKVQREIEIEAAPRDLPHEISVDISKLVEFSDVIHAKDIVLPQGVDLKIKPEEVIASVAEAKEEVVEAPTAIDMSAIEVETKGKEVKEGEVPAAGSPAGDAAKSAGVKPAGDVKKQEGKK